MSRELVLVSPRHEVQVAESAVSLYESAAHAVHVVSSGFSKPAGQAVETRTQEKEKSNRAIKTDIHRTTDLAVTTPAVAVVTNVDAVSLVTALPTGAT